MKDKKYGIIFLLGVYLIFFALLMLALSVCVSVYFGSQTKSRLENAALESTHQIIGHLVGSDLAISNSLGVRNLLSQISSNSSLFYILENDGYIHAGDYQSFAVDLLASQGYEGKCDFASTTNLQAFSGSWYLYCSKIEIQKSDLIPNGVSAKLISLHSLPRNIDFLKFASPLFGGILVLVLLCCLGSLWIFNRAFVAPLNDLRKVVVAASQEPLTYEHQARFATKELDDVGISFYKLIENFKGVYHAGLAAEKKASYVELTRQIVHDIKSPVFVLNLAVESLEQNSAKAKSLLQKATRKISSILESFVAESSGLQGNGDPSAEDTVVGCVYGPMLEDLVEEKVYQYRNGGQNIDFKLDLSIDDHFKCAEIPWQNLYRILGNVLDNAVEAIQKSSSDRGKVFVSGRSCSDGHLICVSDSGCGVAESDLPQLFKEGVSIGKAEGSGIGLWSARQILKGFGGEITVASGQSKGGSLSGYSTTVQIRLNNFEDKCLVGPSLSVSNYEKIIIVDDDASFREVILDKFEDFEGCMEVFPSLALLKKYVSLNDACNKTLFLVDNSFRGVSEKGADFLIKNPQLDAILVTNHYTDTSTLLACREGGLKYLPKPLVNILSVSYTD